MEIIGDVRKCAVEEGAFEKEALQKGMEEKSREFTQKEGQLYLKEF